MGMPKILSEEVRSKLILCESSPSKLAWAEDLIDARGRKRAGRRKGDPAGSLTSKGYWQVKVGNCKFMAHRLVYEFRKGELLLWKEDVDHINGVKSDNSEENLRVTPFNQRNKGKSANNTSGVNGVCKFSTIRNKLPYEIWIASWYDNNGKHRNKSYSCNKYGDEQALELACSYRKTMISLLNEDGGGYTNRHGN